MNKCVVVTAYNEEKYLARFLNKLEKQTIKFIVVDDGSIDSTKQIAQKYTPHVLSHMVNLGKGAAMKTGAEFAFKNLRADAIIFMDGDDQHDIADLEKFVKVLKQKNPPNLVLGVRTLKNEMPKLRIFANQFASIIIKLFFGTYVPDIPSGFKAISKDIYRKLAWESSDYGVELEIACRTAKEKIPFKTVTIKTIYHDMDRGMDLLDILKMLYKVFLWRINL